MHTPRLCIDGRASREFSARGIVAQEVIDQLVSGNGEGEASSEWIEKSRTVLVTHPRQVFSGQLRRYETRRTIGKSPLYWMWERGLVKSAQVSAFHRFYPIDRVGLTLPCQTITTLLPAKRRLPFFLPRGKGHHYVVPSQLDADFLEEKYLVPAEQIAVVTPSVRRYVHHVPGPKTNPLGQILVLYDTKAIKRDRKRTVQILERSYPEWHVRSLKMKDTADFSGTNWIKQLNNVRLVAYLTDRPCDWPTLALEAFFWGIPVMFPDQHKSLSELLPQSPFKLSNFLIELPDEAKLKKRGDEARLKLFSQGVFAPLSQAVQYTRLYQKLEPTTH